RAATSALASVSTVVRCPIAASARLRPAAPSGDTPSPSGATASAMSRKSRPATTDYRSVGLPLLGRAALVLFPRKLIHRGVLHYLLAGDLPCFLDDPRERTVLTSRLILDL